MEVARAEWKEGYFRGPIYSDRSGGNGPHALGKRGPRRLQKFAPPTAAAAEHTAAMSPVLAGLAGTFRKSPILMRSSCSRLSTKFALAWRSEGTADAGERGSPRPGQGIPCLFAVPNTVENQWGSAGKGPVPERWTYPPRCSDKGLRSVRQLRRSVGAGEREFLRPSTGTPDCVLLTPMAPHSSWRCVALKARDEYPKGGVERTTANGKPSSKRLHRRLILVLTGPRLLSGNDSIWPRRKHQTGGTTSRCRGGQWIGFQTGGLFIGVE